MAGSGVTPSTLETSINLIVRSPIGSGPARLASVSVLRRGGRGLALAALLALVATACGDDGSTEPADATATKEADGSADGQTGRRDAAPFPVKTFTQTFVDETRPTDDPVAERDAATRSLETDIYVPDGEGPFPLIVHAHGFDGNAGKFSQLLTSWAEAGYVVAAPTFPLTNDVDDAGSVLDDFMNQPADVSLVIDRLLALSAGDHAMLAGRIDEERIGVSGLSLGGTTVYGVGFNSCCRDQRISAVVVMNGLPLEFDGGSFPYEDIPLMLSLSRDDPIVPYDQAIAPYEEASGPKVLMTLDSDGHFEPYEDVASPHDEVVAEATTAFWNAHLRDDPDAIDRLVAAVESHDLTEVTIG